MANKKKNDILLVFILLFAAMAGLLLLVITAKQGKEAVVIQDGKETARYSLSKAQTIDIISQDGKINTLVITDGTAYVSYADCRDKICVLHRRISKEDEAIICLPNKLVIEID